MNDIGTKSSHCQIMCVEPEITVMSNAVLLSLGFINVESHGAP